MGSSGQKSAMPDQMGYCTHCSTLQMRYTTMRRLSNREDGDLSKATANPSRQEGNNCI